jgi:hypothetical protein
VRGRPAAAKLVLLAVVALAGCGGGSSDDPSRDEAPSPAAVIRSWSDTLRAGHVAQAASYFALPATVANGTPPLRLSTRDQVRAFNASLPCGARLVKTSSSSRFTTAEFVLTERPGPGSCGTGTGQRARVTFVIRGGKIVEWRRVSTNPEPPGTVA